MFDKVTLELSYEQFIVLHKVLQHFRLGDDNLYRSAISDLAIELEKAGSEEEVNTWLEDNSVGEPYFTVEDTEEDGMTINVFEEE
jgi:hypothetical protein